MMTNTGARVVEGVGSIGMGAIAPVSQFLGDAGTDATALGTQIGAAALGLGVLGASVSGALIGGVASSDWRGVGTGALATSGLSAVATGYILTKAPETRTMGWVALLGGLAAAGGGIYLAVTRKKR